MSSRAERNPSVAQLVRELWELVVEYFKQETIVPLQQLRRYVVFGLLGAVLLGTGVLFLALAGLRALQTETDTTFTGNWSWAPYGVVFTGLVVGGAVTWRARRAGRDRRDRKELEQR
jgi:hypothetical protein